MEVFKHSSSRSRQAQIRPDTRFSLASMGPSEAEEGLQEDGVELRVVVGRELKGEELFKYHWRRTCKENIVKVYSTLRGKNGASWVEIIVKCEKVQVGSVGIDHSLTLGQMLYFAKTIIKASLFLSKTFGYFSINAKMIGVNRKGELKIWINQNFADNGRQYPISSQIQFYSNLISFLQDYVKGNKLFQLYLRKLAENIACLKQVQFYEQFHGAFLRLHWIKQPQRIEVRQVERQEHVVCEVDGRPSLDKYSNQTADITESINMDSRIHQRGSKNIHLSHIPPSFSHSKNLQKKQKENNPNCMINTASSSFAKPLQDNLSFHCERKDVKPSLQKLARLQESIIMESKPTSKKSYDDILNGYGRLCESTTVQAMILEQFQWIYE